MKSQEQSISFGAFFRKKRLESRMTLRYFCQRYGYDPAYISRVERGVLLPPEDKEKLTAFAKVLNIAEGSNDWVTFFDLAFISKGKIPSDIITDNRNKHYLPLLFRTVRGKKVTPEKLKKLIKLLNGS